MNAFALLASSLAIAQTGAQSPSLQIDPLLIYQAAEVWSVIAKPNNPVWPGWNASDTPLLIYFPDKQDVLINHPKPPEGFVPYTPPAKLPFSKIFVRNGKTQFEYDGQNTSTDVNGVQTLVVADTLSTRRQSLESMIGYARSSSDDMKETIDSSLLSNPYDQMTMFAHEAFHAYQHRRAPKKGGNELALTGYPSLSVENNVGYALEADFLREALEAKSDADARSAALKWLAVRQDRRKALKPDLAAYEDGTEFNEGTAKYIEYRLLQTLEGRQPAPEMWLRQGFNGYGDLSAERARLLSQMQSMMSGKTSVNNDKYGASPVRMRLYYSGMGVGALLDRMGSKWHDRIFADGVSLTGLAQEAIRATPAELEAALVEVKRSPRYAQLTAEKQKLAQEGEAHIQEVLDSFDKAPGTLVLDYSGLEKPRVGLGFTPFGVLRVDDRRTIYRLLPMRGIINELNFAEEAANPILMDSGKKQITLMLKEAVDASALDRLLGSPDWRTKPVEAKSLSLPGVTVNNMKATVKLDGKRVVVTVN